MSPHPKRQILDHGYVQLVEVWGSDERIVEAARMSTQKGFQGWGTTEKPGDEKLLCYLRKNKHDTPFEMAGMIIEVQAPIFVFREWMRHRTFSYSEISARYAPVPDVNYVPTVERCLLGGGHLTKQAGTVEGAALLTEGDAEQWRVHLQDLYEIAESLYQAAMRQGVPKELARLCMLVGRYSRMRASANLRNWLAFLALRSDVVPSGKAAQWEIRQFANVCAELISEHFPRTYALFVEQQPPPVTLIGA